MTTEHPASGVKVTTDYWFVWLSRVMSLYVWPLLRKQFITLEV